MTKRNKMLTWAIPIGVAIILFLTLWVNQIINERQLPSPHWSRTIHTNINSALETPYVLKDSKGINLYTLSHEGITHSVLNEKLHVVDKSVLKTKGNVQRVIWANGTSLIYKMNDNLHLQSNGKDKIIAKNVGSAKVHGNLVYYVQEKTLLSYNLNSGAHTNIYTFNDPIQTISLENKDAIIATQDETSNLHFFDLKMSGGSPLSHEFAQFSGLSHGNISVMDTVQHDGKLGLFFTTHVLRQGEYFYDYYLEFPYEKLADGSKPVQINERNITYTVKDTGEYLRTPMNTHLYLRDGKPILLFRSEGQRTLRENAINIYEGYQNEKGEWIAERRSTSPEITQLPFLVDDETIGYLIFASDNNYQIGFTSMNPSLINQSMHYQTQDFSHSFSNAALSLSRIFMLFLLSIAYTIPALLIYAIISFTKVDLIERDSQAVKWILLGAFLISQYFLVNNTEDPAFHHFAPGYLTFHFSQWVIPTIMAVISLLLVKWVKSKEWSMLFETFYTMILFSVMEFFTFGPYFF